MGHIGGDGREFNAEQLPPALQEVDRSGNIRAGWCAAYRERQNQTSQASGIHHKLAV
jgi:hypothetical protein